MSLGISTGCLRSCEYDSHDTGTSLSCLESGTQGPVKQTASRQSGMSTKSGHAGQFAPTQDVCAAETAFDAAKSPQADWWTDWIVSDPMVSNDTGGASTDHSQRPSAITSSSRELPRAGQQCRQGTTLSSSHVVEDFSQLDRALLLDAFYTRARPLFGSHYWTRSRIHESLALPESDRPHPCLFYAMYAVGAAFSDQRQIRDKAESWYRLAVEEMDGAIAERKRLLDVIHAGVLAGEWLSACGRSLESYMLVAKIASLALACDLHCIESLSYPDPCPAERDWGLLPPLRNKTQKSERCHAFWACYTLHMSSSMLRSWPVIVQDQDIRTPLPFYRNDPKEDSSSGDAVFRLSDLYRLDKEERRAIPTSELSVLSMVLHLVHRAKALMESQKDPKGIDRDGKSVVSVRSGDPEAFETIMSATEAVECRLRDSLRVRAWQKPPWKHDAAPIIHVCLPAIRLLLHTPPEGVNELDQAFLWARELTSFVRLWSTVHSGGVFNDEKRAIPSIAEFYISLPLSWMDDHLKNLAKRLRENGRLHDAMSLLDESSELLSELKDFRRRHDLE